MSSCCSSQENVSKVCPVCGREGQIVKSITVKNLVIEEEVKRVEERDYYICFNPECEVVYFDNEGEIFNQQQIKVPIWYKKGADPKYICYCARVTEDEIIDAVTNGAKDIKSVMEMTGAMKEGKCLINNPTGKCCHQEVKKVIDKALESI
ncbi:(2Fe-2S)-binding protein [Anoxybacter fermentans]|uniref:(2Fe-2S)-binding protein n=1 Tax=Anoxybacter fermentans TaxID=1323375 RepID=A0A3S9T1L6_9FIRM|nr:(2Fe-2S)-binding protein [Anoxybacter fermentans]AZR74506.1 (2Fe-2S)-binding protein [Anoxybacter fermentans]